MALARATGHEWVALTTFAGYVARAVADRLCQLELITELNVPRAFRIVGIEVTSENGC